MVLVRGNRAGWRAASPEGLQMHCRTAGTGAACLAALAVWSCSPAGVEPSTPMEAAGAAPEGLILSLNEGERRVRRPKSAGEPGLPDPFILKVDRRNGGSSDLVMGYEELGPGQEIPAHSHLIADEIIFVHKGSGQVTLGDREATVSAGGTVYIPRNVRIGLKNTGSEPLGIAFVFSKPGFEELMRDNSVLEGEPVTPISAEERSEIQARHSWHTVRER